MIASSGGGNIFEGSVNPITGRYLMVVPAGTYSLKVCYQPSGNPLAAGVTVTYDDPSPVQVSGDMTRDETLPSVTLFNVSGAVFGLNSLSSGTDATIEFTSADNRSGRQFVLDSNGSYQGAPPAGNYLAGGGKTIQPSQFQFGSLSLYNLGSLQVGGGPATGNYSVPATAALSGTVQLVGQPVMPGSPVDATDTSAPAIAQVACCAASGTSAVSTDFTGGYQLTLALNRAFGVNVAVPLGQGTNLLGVLLFPVSAGSVTMSGNTSRNFNLPGLPGQVTISGKVRNSNGNAVANVSVSAYSQSIAGASDLGFVSGGQTDAAGNYSITVLSGTNYQLNYTPPAPKP